MKTCIIVDAYRYSKDYIHYLSKKDRMCIHVQSTPDPIPDLINSSTYNPHDYIANYIYDGVLDHLLFDLMPHTIDAVIPGMESGVALADELSQTLGVKNNIYEKRKARRNKFAMLEQLKADGVRCMKYIRSKKVEEALQWIAQHTTYPVVLKPLESAGTDSVFVCETPDAVKHHFKTIFGNSNCFGLYNDSVLVQEFLQGTEYMINSVSLNGRHHFTDIWKCHKRQIKNHGMIYDREELLSANGDIQNHIKYYLTLVLNSLGYRYGAAHAEIMYTAEGPVLIEVGARVGGNVNCFSHNECLDHNQLELNVDSYIDEKAYQIKTETTYRVLKHAMTILLSTQQSGTIKKLPILRTIHECASLFWYRLSVKLGDYLKPTRDLFSSPGKIILIHEDKKLLERDYHKLMTAMPTGFVTE